jgi:SET domain-containing protein
MEIMDPECDSVDLPTVKLSVKTITGKGRGVFANEHIASGTLVSISHLLVFPSSDETSPEKEVLSHYTYTVGLNQALALGLGSLFNHSRDNNVGFVIDKQNLFIRYIAIHDIAEGEELCINYGNNLWFEDVTATVGLQDSCDSDDDPMSKITL